MSHSPEPRETNTFRATLLVPPLTILAIFTILLLGPPPTRVRLVVAGLVTAGLIAIFDQWARLRGVRAREATRDAIYRTAGGDLTLSRKELARSGDAQLAEALHGLLVEMERILGSFIRLAGAVSGVARELTSRGRDLSQAVVLQTNRAEETAGAIESTDSALRSLRKSMEELAGTAENAGASLHEMSASITEVSLSAQGLRTFVDETAQALSAMLGSLDEVAGSVEKLTSLAEETARATGAIREAALETDRQTRTAASLAERVARSAVSGKAAVSGTAEGMTGIRQAVTGAAAAATSLGEISTRIGEILRVIEEIAGRTNLLALNASIIAAQAGESGKAFSVVAGDIRELSDRTGLSTEEVRSLVVAVRGGVDQVRSLLTDALRRAEEGVTLSRTADAELTDIESLAAESKKAAAGIALVAAQQTQDVARVSEASSRVSEEVGRIYRASRAQVETAHGVGLRAERVKESTEQLSRAMQEQAMGSRQLLESMGKVTSAVESINQATGTLADGSSAVVQSMEVIRRATAQNAYAATAMNQTAQALEQEALLLKERASVFRLPAPKPGGRLRAALRYLDDENFDPAFSQTVPQAVLVKTWGEVLVRFAEGTRVVPELAERWEVDPTGTLFTFHLRRGVNFHEGGTLTSLEVKQSLERFLSPELAAPLAGAFDVIQGAPDFRAGHASHVSGIDTPDPATIRFNLERPLPFFLHLLTLPDVTIVPPSMQNRTKARLSPSGTGPFIPREIAFGKVARFDRFDGYWDRANVALDGVDLDISEDSEAGVFQRFLDGKLDVIWDVPYREAAQLMSDPKLRPYVDSSVQLHTSYVVLRCDRKPLDDVRVRRALNYAVDRNTLNERFFAGLTVVASSILPPHLLGHDTNLRPYRHDPDKAKALLREAGHEKLTLNVWLSPKDSRDPQNLVFALAKDLEAVGVTVQVETLTGEEMTARKKKGDYPHLRLTRWFADFPDPDTFFNALFYSKTEDVADFGFKNDDVDRLVEKGARAMDGREREGIYRELNRLIQSEAPGIFLFHNRGFVVHQPNLRGVRSYLMPPVVRWADLSFEA